ncbi:MAG: hypothetical protein V1759_03460 [bacterium]
MENVEYLYYEKLEELLQLLRNQKIKRNLMNKIITRPKEIVKNEKVLYAGNHYLSAPIIDCQNGGIKNINVVSLSNKALLELKGEANLFKPHFYQEGKEIEIEKIDVSKEQ